MHITKLALIVEYEGTRYHGFQLQPHSPTIQEELERAIERFTGERLRVHCASRTDAGVHAKGQVVSFRSCASYAPGTFVGALNHYLPSDIGVLAAYAVPEEFDVRKQAVCREYEYVLLHRLSPSPLLRERAYWVSAPLEVARMNEAAALLLSQRDFAPFSGPLPDKASTWRKLSRAEFTPRGGLLTFEVTGDSFLPQQVRRMAGALVDVGLGKRSIPDFRAMIDCKKRGVAGPTLPPQGLFLKAVRYRGFPPCQAPVEEENRKVRI